MVTQPSFLRRRGSNSSLNSVGTQETGPTLRMCSNCRKLLELHKSKQEQRHYKPTVVELYEVGQSLLCRWYGNCSSGKGIGIWPIDMGDQSTLRYEL